MRKYIFSFILIIALSLSALYLFESKEVNAAENSNFNRTYDVRFELLENQIVNEGITWRDGSTEPILANFDYDDGFYQDLDSRPGYVSISRSNLYPNKDFDYVLSDFSNWENVNTQHYVQIFYDGIPTVFRVSQLNNPNWFLNLDHSKIDITQPFIVRYDFVRNNIGGREFIYRTSATQNADGSYTYQTTTTLAAVTNIFSLGAISTLDYSGLHELLNPVSYGDELFTGWLINDVFYSYYDLFDYYLPYLTSITAVAQYSNQSSYVVSFYDGFNLLSSQTFPGGYNFITPPNFTFPLGQKLEGWSLKLGGFAVSLDNFYLVEDTNFYAIKSFNSNSTVNGGKFEIPYEDCGNFDIPCHLGNAVVYFLNEFPLVSDVASFIYPIADFLNEFPQYFEVFEGLGLIFVFSMGILLICFIFKFMR